MGQWLCLLDTSLCCQPLTAVKVQVLHWSDHCLALQVQPALLLQLLTNSRDEVPAIVHIRVETSPLSPHLLPTVPGSGAGRVSFHNMVVGDSWIHSITHRAYLELFSIPVIPNSLPFCVSYFLLLTSNLLIFLTLDLLWNTPCTINLKKQVQWNQNTV